MVAADRIEALGPAERIVNAVTQYTDHLVHNRPGIVTPDVTASTGVRWEPAIWKTEDEQKTVYRLVRQGTKNQPVRVGILDGAAVKDKGQTVAQFRNPGLFPEVARYLYQQIADVWSMDQDFVARWASWSFARDHRDLKVLLTAFMLVQDRYGAPVVENGIVLFNDEDYREVGEAMCLTRSPHTLSPKLLTRVGDLLALPEVAAINRELGFGRSARTPTMGRYNKLVTKWLEYREQNPQMIEGLVRAGYRNTVRRLACRVGYRPKSAKFFAALRWRQSQATDGRRTMAIGVEVEKAESWGGLSEQEICERIVAQRPDYKRIVGLLPQALGLTRAIMAAAVEAKSLSDADFVILTPTFEDLGLLDVPGIRATWKEAIDKVENQRAANVARNVRSRETREQLEAAADTATVKTIEKVTRNLRVYCLIDKSSSMAGALERAQQYLTKFLGAFPLDRLHCAVFNTFGTEIEIKGQQAAAVAHAFKGHKAGGGTHYAAGVQALARHKPAADEDVLMLFIGDEGDRDVMRLTDAARELNPVAFGLLAVESPRYGRGTIVRDTAKRLGIPCFEIDEKMFETDDPYAITRVIRDLIAATPVVKAAAAPRPRRSLIDEILATPLLKKPAWA